MRRGRPTRGLGKERTEVSGRNKWRELWRPIREDPIRRARVEEKRRELDALIALHDEQREPPGVGADVGEAGGDPAGDGSPDPERRDGGEP